MLDNLMVYKAVFVIFSIQNVMPLSSGLLRSQKRNPTPQCPPRFQVQHLSPVLWTRIPDSALNVLVDRPDEHHGWRIQCYEPLQVMTLQIPDESRLKRDLIYVFGVVFTDKHRQEMFLLNICHPTCFLFPCDLWALGRTLFIRTCTKCSKLWTRAFIWFWAKNNSVIVFSFWWHSRRSVDILELSEFDDLLTFHHNTLLLYCSLCALGNTRVCHALCSHVDQSQFFYAIQNPHLPGLLRSAYYQLLIQVPQFMAF